MNILPKKSWHVRNRDNVARVRRDEAAAEAERRKRDARALRAEQEARTELLRKKARGLGGGTTPPSPPASSAPPVLFPPPHEAGEVATPNREHEEEKRQEQERRERALGVLTYLGQSAAEAQTRPPWYLRPPRGHTDGAGGTDGRGDPPRPGDPLVSMRRLRGREPPPKNSPPKRNSPPAAKRAGAPSLEELRRQRLQREAAEAARTRELLLGGSPKPCAPPRTNEPVPTTPSSTPSWRGEGGDPPKNDEITPKLHPSPKNCGDAILWWRHFAATPILGGGQTPLEKAGRGKRGGINEGDPPKSCAPPILPPLLL
ncbi:leukocyte receptor cluster member 1 [Caloenas nicobarica]|uniref:leukocyte receptor cluster member 1 n=1 Tax=Caloenas nicobarica TaxID=187106 RepID=UPI0032B75F18